MIAFVMSLGGLGVSALPPAPIHVAQADVRQAAAIRKACSVGALPPDQCRNLTGARRNTSGFSTPAGSGQGDAFPLTADRGERGDIFQDEQGRYRLTVPDGWNTSDNNGAVSFSGEGTSVQVLTMSGGSLQAVAQQVADTYRQGFSRFQIANQGPTTLGRHPSFGMAVQAVDKRGRSMAVTILAQSAGSGNYLVLVASGPPSSQALTKIMQLANSVRFHGE